MKIRPAKKIIFWFLLYLILCLLIVLLLSAAWSLNKNAEGSGNITYVEKVQASIDDGSWQEVALPHRFKELSPRTLVRIKANIIPKSNDSIYLKTVYAPAKFF